jgi:predicted NAD/FAD-dependent oxidoreductase
MSSTVAVVGAGAAGAAAAYALRDTPGDGTVFEKSGGVSGGARPEERVPMTRMRKRIAELEAQVAKGPQA